MLDDMKLADELYHPTNFWEHGGSLIQEEILKFGVENFRSLPRCLDFFVPSYSYPGYHNNPGSYSSLNEALEGLQLSHHKYDLLLNQFLSGQMQALNDYRVYLASDIDKHPYIDKVSESCIGKPVEQFTFDGRCFSRSFLNYLLGLSFLKRTCNTKDIHTVLEIGGGFGSLCEILLGDKRNDSFCIDVDIVPTIFVATYYLQQLFGEENVGDYATLRNEDILHIEQLQKKYKAVVINSWQLPKLRGEIDLFVNFISFQEMEPDVVKNYLKNVERLGAKFVLSRNIREGKERAEDVNSPGVITPIKSDDYDKFLPNYHLLGINTIPFGCQTVDGFHSELKVYAKKD
jgi:putative sugar O-methyltransferase